MKNYAARLMEAKGIRYDITVPAELSRLRLPLDFRRNFFLIFKEALNNIVRHAGAKRVELTLSRRGEHIVMVVQDDGKGFDLKRLSRKNGLLNMEKRAAMIQGSFNIESRIKRGTRMTVRARLP